MMDGRGVEWCAVAWCGNGATTWRRKMHRKMDQHFLFENTEWEHHVGTTLFGKKRRFDDPGDLVAAYIGGSNNKNTGEIY